jgi:hypothetical protein
VKEQQQLEMVNAGVEKEIVVSVLETLIPTKIVNVTEFPQRYAGGIAVSMNWGTGGIAGGMIIVGWVRYGERRYFRGDLSVDELSEELRREARHGSPRTVVGGGGMTVGITPGMTVGITPPGMKPGTTPGIMPGTTVGMTPGMVGTIPGIGGTTLGTTPGIPS